MESPFLRLSGEDLQKAFKGLLYAVGSVVVTFLIGLLPFVNLSAEWMWILPVVNFTLVALQKLFSNSDGEIFRGESK